MTTTIVIIILIIIKKYIEGVFKWQIGSVCYCIKEVLTVGNRKKDESQVFFLWL